MTDYRRDTRYHTPYRVTIEATVFAEDFGVGTLEPSDWDMETLLTEMREAPDVDIVSCVELVAKTEVTA